MTFLDRAGCTALAILIGFDQMAQTLLVAPFAVLGLADPPDPDATISGLVGRRAAAGASWAVAAAHAIDALFLILTLGREVDHTAKTAAREMTCWRPE